MKKSIDALEIVNQIVDRSKAADGGVQRLLYTPNWLSAQLHLKEIMKSEGFVTYFDSIGNLFGRFAGKDQGKTVLTGSHIDTVKNGGKLDGLYGIAGGIEAVLRLVHEHGRPDCNLEVISFAEEEGSRFPCTFWGSKNLLGIADHEAAGALFDQDGLSFSDEMENCGFSLGGGAGRTRRDISAFVELHIEQGAVLERENAEIGIVEAIVGQKRYSVKILGTANHAGTTPMKYRRDALACAAEIITEIRNSALVYGTPLVATVGKIEVRPNNGNVIASQVEFTVDMRHADGEKLDCFEADFLSIADAIAGKHKTEIEMSRYLDVAPVYMNRNIVTLIEASCRKLGRQYLRMPSGAGHDSQIMAGFVDTGMIFVPSRDGISHSYLEYTAPENLKMGVDVLCEALFKLSYSSKQRLNSIRIKEDNDFGLFQ